MNPDLGEGKKRIGSLLASAACPPTPSLAKALLKLAPWGEGSSAIAADKKPQTPRFK